MAHNNLGKALYAKNEYDEAINHFSAAISITNHDVCFYQNRGSTYITIGQYQKAVEDYNEIIHRKPDYADAYNNRGIAYHYLGKKALACRDFQKTCALGNCNALNEFKRRGTCR